MGDSFFYALAREKAPWLRALRERLHRCPEMGNREHETAAILEKELRALGLETRRALGTAIVATLRGNLPGKTVALRAELDALPVTEETGAAFASQTPGLMHACGHDVHMAAAIGAAALLSARRETLPGTVKLFFQPDEEGEGGARRMIEAGCLQEPPVDAIFGAHVSPDLPPGVCGVRSGRFYAAADTFAVTVLGHGGHAAQPEKGRDALLAAARMVCEMEERREALEARYGRVVMTTGMLRGGTAGNVLADRAEFCGILRTLEPRAREAATEGLRETLERVAKRCGVRTECRLRESYPGVVNDDAMAALVENVAASLLGAERAVRIPQPTMATEDFGCFLEHIPGCFYHIGAGGAYPLHSPRFLPDGDTLVTASALNAAVLFAFLCSPAIP